MDSRFSWFKNCEKKAILILSFFLCTKSHFIYYATTVAVKKVELKQKLHFFRFMARICDILQCRKHHESISQLLCISFSLEMEFKQFSYIFCFYNKVPIYD